MCAWGILKKYRKSENITGVMDIISQVRRLKWWGAGHKYGLKMDT